MSKSASILSPPSIVPLNISAVLLILVLATTVTRPLCAAPDEAEQEAESELSEEESLGRGLLTDRKTVMTLQAARERLAAGDVDRALDEFRRLQTSDPSNMMPSASGSEAFVPLFRVLFDLFFEFPEDIRRRQIGRTSDLADQTLRDILATGDMQSLPILIQESPGTDASIQAHLILARLHIDRGHDIAARAWLTPLLHRNVPDNFRIDAARVFERLTMDRDAVAQPSTANQDAKAESPEAVTVPGHLRWQFHPLSSPTIDEQLSTFREAATRSNVVPQTTWPDEVDDQVVYRRTLRGVAAVDIATGQPNWHYPLLPALDGLIESTRTSSSTRSVYPTSAMESFARLEQGALANLFCRDNVLSRVSSDEDQIYVVATDDVPSAVTRTINGGFMRQTSQPQFSRSRLVALEKKTGRRVWTTSGKSFADVIGTKTDACWMAGPPVPVLGRLYSVFEWNGEIQLGCLSAATGELLWNRVLAFPDQSIDKDAIRRLWGATPSVGGGLIWCPTTVGWTVCVDELTRTVLWASMLREESPSSGLRSGRGRPVAITRAAQLSARWPESRMLRVGDRLVVLPHELHEIAFLDALTGEQIRRLTVNPSAVLVHADRTKLVIAEPPDSSQPRTPDDQTSSGCTLRSVDIETGNEDWKVRLNWSHGLPTGRGIIRNGTLLVPMSSGLVLKVDPATGNVTVSEDVVLPVNGWGHFVEGKAIGEDLLYSSPERLTRLSRQKSPESPQDPIELATALMDSEKWLEAVNRLAVLPDSDVRISDAKSLRFKCYQQLAQREPQVYLPSLKAEADSPLQRLDVQVLEASWLLTRDDHLAAAKTLVEILKARPSLLSKPLPVTFSGSASENTIASNSVSATPSLLTWATAEYSRLLDAASDREQIVGILNGVSPAVLVNIHSPAVRPELLRYLMEEEPGEVTIHLLRHSVELGLAQQPPQTAFAEEVSALGKLVSQLEVERGPASSAATRLLVNAAVLDLPTEFQAAMQDSMQNAGTQFLSRDALNERFRLGMQAHFEEWSEDPYQALPVGRVMSTAQAVRLLPAVASDDPFLREYQWTAIRGEYGRLQADSVVASTPEQWSVPGVIEVYGTYSNQADLLRRADSMLVLHTQKGITGISVLDQKVAWSRTPAGNGVTSFSSSANRSFAQFDAAIHKLPSRSTWSQYEIAGVGNGWLCILQKRTVEVVDLMSGATLWTVELPSNANRVFTTDNLVIAGSTTRGEVYCFDGRDGSSVSLADIEKLSRKTLCGAGRWLVYWVAGFAEQPNRLQWLDPITGEQHLEVPLTGMQQFSFLDDKTLIGVSDDQQMLTVDLHNGTTRRIDFSIEEESGDADAANWKAKRVKVAADSLNFYFMSHEEQNRRPLIQPAGRQLSRFDGGLRAVDRQTGKLRWVTNDQTELLATTDQPELPLMVFIENTPFQPNQPVTMASQAVFRGIHKLTGTELFRQPIPSRYGLRYTSVSSAKANTLDIGVYGNRIRMQGGEARPQSP